MSSAYRKKLLEFLREINLDMRLNGMEKWLLFVLPQQQRDDDGGFTVSARQLSAYLGCMDKTAANHLRNIERAGYISIAQNGTNPRGGFKIFFRRTSILAALSFLLSVTPALHKLSLSDTRASSTSHNYILSDKRRKKRQSKQVASGPEDRDLSEKRLNHRVQHTGQWALWNRSESITAQSDSC